MRKLLVTLVVLGSFGPVASASAGLPIPKIPKNCHEWNELLGIQNVRSCDDPSG